MFVQLDDPLDIRRQTLGVRTGPDEIGHSFTLNVDVPPPVLRVGFRHGVFGFAELDSKPVQRALAGDRVDRVGVLAADVELGGAKRNKMRHLKTPDDLPLCRERRSPFRDGV